MVCCFSLKLYAKTLLFLLRMHNFLEISTRKAILFPEAAILLVSDEIARKPSQIKVIEY